MTARNSVSPHVLTVDETAAALRISVRQVRRMISERRIPYVRVGRSVRIAPDDLTAFIRSGRVESITESTVFSHVRKCA